MKKTLQIDDEDFIDEEPKFGRTNERSSMLKLESLDQIKRRDMISKQKELLA